MILGVDVSTSITGFAIVADDEIVFYDSIDLRKFKNVFKGKMPKRQKPGMKSLMGVAGKGMMKGAAGKSMKRKLKRLI